MSMWTALALIAIAGIVAGIFNDKGNKGTKRDKAAISAEFEAINNRLDSLESDLRGRIETLERIVTSSKEDLKRQFDHLDKVS